MDNAKQTDDPLSSATLVAMESVLRTVKPVSGESGVEAPVSSVTHENKQLVYGRPGLPLCGSGCDCAARSLPGGAVLGPLPVYLYPEQQILYETAGAEAIKDTLAASQPNFCLLCIRLVAQTTKLAAEAAGCGVRRGGAQGVVYPPFTNLVNEVDGYRQSAMVITPDDVCIAGGVFICGSTKGLSVRFNKIANSWFIQQSAEIVYTPEPFL